MGCRDLASCRAFASSAALVGTALRVGSNTCWGRGRGQGGGGCPLDSKAMTEGLQLRWPSNGADAVCHDRREEKTPTRGGVVALRVTARSGSCSWVAVSQMSKVGTQKRRGWIGARPYALSTAFNGDVRVWLGWNTFALCSYDALHDHSLRSPAAVATQTACRPGGR